MTMEERNVLFEASDILKTLGGNNGFANLQPKLKQTLRSYASKLEKIARYDIQKELDTKGTAAIAPGVKLQNAPRSREDIEMIGMQEES